MEIRYKMTRADMRSGLKSAWIRSTRFKAVLLSLSALPMLSFLAMRFATAGSLRGQDVVTAIVVGLVFALAMPLMMIMRTKTAERILSIDHRGISTTVGQLQGNIPWTKVGAIEATEREVLIFGTSPNFFAIPLRAFADAEASEVFVQAARQYWMAARNDTAA